MDHSITHLYLISKQASPNISPALNPDTRPRRVIFLVSPEMRQQADWLESVLKVRGIKIQQTFIDHAYDIEHIQSRILSVLEKEHLAVESKTLILNASGGTKPMSIAAYDVFRRFDLPVFFIHPEKDQLIWMWPEGKPNIELADRIKLEPFLAAHGSQTSQTPIRNIRNADKLPVAERLVSSINAYQGALKTLNYLAHKAEYTLTSRIAKSEVEKLGDLLTLFQQHGFVSIEQDQLIFPDEDSRFFANGGWLESWVFHQIRTLRQHKPQIQDLARSVEVQRGSPEQPIPNELDIACLSNNRLYIVECKTRQFKGRRGQVHSSETLYKLDSLSDLMGGLHAHAMLVSFQPIPEHALVRSKDLNIPICHGEELINLKLILSQWIQ